MAIEKKESDSVDGPKSTFNVCETSRSRGRGRGRGKRGEEQVTGEGVGFGLGLGLVAFHLIAVHRMLYL